MINVSVLSMFELDTCKTTFDIVNPHRDIVGYTFNFHSTLNCCILLL
jgi:hypothetical protein